jgi:hypothetical protein
MKDNQQCLVHAETFLKSLTQADGLILSQGMLLKLTNNLGLFQEKLHEHEIHLLDN